MLEEDLDDTHLCIKCSSTIVGLDNYIQHRKSSCGGKTTRSGIVGGYGGFGYPDSSVFRKSTEEVDDSRGKVSKSLNDPYDLPYELGADVFFSSLQLQSVQASSTGGGASGSSENRGKPVSRQQMISVKPMTSLLSSARDEAEGEWQEEPTNNTDNLMKVVRDISESKKFEPIFKPITFTHNESPEPEQSDDEEDDDDDFEDDEEDEDYVPTPFSGGKWKPGSQPPPRSGGKWKTGAQTVAKVHSAQTRRKRKSFAVSEKAVPESGGKWKPGCSKWKRLLEVASERPESPDVMEPRTGGKWKPGDTKPEIPATGGKWKPRKLHPIQKWKSTDSQESHDVMEEPTGGKWKSKTLVVPECGGKWKPGYEKPPLTQKPDFSDEHESPERQWKPNYPKKAKMDPPRTSEAKWLSPDQESPEIMESWKSQGSEKSPREQESPDLLEPHTGGKWKPGQRPGSHIPTGGKWKPGQSPGNNFPTGGKWKPGHRPEEDARKWKQTTTPSPVMDDHEAWDDPDGIHPPVEHTKGKWVPGTKIDRLQFKDAEVPPATQNFWCNICCRKLKTKAIYEKHLQSNVHLRKSEAEEQLERVAVEQLELSHRIMEPPALLLELSITPEPPLGKRKRRKIFIKCEICKYRMQTFLVGKHLISHYHFVRMVTQPQRSFSMILEYIHQIVLQSPYQCVPCRFFTNTEENFLLHWNSSDHRDKTEGPGKFWCSFCRFECEDNNQMMRHLLCSDHREVILAINRSVPICITKKVNIECPKCHQSFRYNMELRQHASRCDASSAVPIGTASDEYQSRFRCELCPDVALKSNAALQRHRKFKHNELNFHCHVCNIEFQTAAQAVKHRKTATHKKASAKKPSGKKKINLNCKLCKHVSTSEMEAVLHRLIHRDEKKSKVDPGKCPHCEKRFNSRAELRSHITTDHPNATHSCPLCGESFVFSHEVGFHRRYKICVPKGKAEQTTTLPSTSQTKLEEPVQSGEPAKSREPAKSWLCSDCPFSSDFESELIYHQIIHTKGVEALQTDGKLKCPLCEKSFPKRSLRFHIRLHTNEKMFKCDLCDASFARRHNYKDHMRSMHASSEDAIKRPPKRSTEESFVCDTCGKIFKNKYALKYHSKIHMERDGKFRCPVEHCLYIGRNKGALQMHSSTHCLQTEFKCEEIGCRYRGKTAIHLKRHMESHSEPVNLLKCPECDFVARRKAHIVRHRRIHTGEMPYDCPHCDYKCAYIENLRKHILTTKKHPGKFIYECDKCSPKSAYKTNYNNEFQMHLTVAHPTQ